jgi:hypothetical protein
MPILGILASSKLIAAAGDYESIATVTVGSGGSSSVSFTSIAADWTHLQIRGIVRSSRSNSGNGDTLSIQLNSDTSSTYPWHYVRGNGTAASASAGTGNTFMDFQRVADAGAGSNIFGVAIIDILDYTNTNKNTTVRSLAGYDNNGSGVVALNSGLWTTTSAVTSITITASGGAQTISQYSHFALYGIKGA